MFTHSIERLKNLVGDENLSWSKDLINITSNHETAMQKFQKIAFFLYGLPWSQGGFCGSENTYTPYSKARTLIKPNILVIFLS